MYFSRLGKVSFVSLIFVTSNVVVSTIASSSTWFPTTESLVHAAFDAIQHLHAQMDDDNSGSVDLDESSDFIEKELSQSNGNSRQTRFHGSDTQINVNDLWLSFQSSPLYSWTEDDVGSWLHGCVDGAEKYEALFREHGVTGLHLPLIAANKDHFFNRFFGRNVVAAEDKKRMILKAQDGVLFGPCKLRGHNWIKDLLLAAAAVITAGVVVAARRQRAACDVEMENLQKNIDSLTSAENDLETLTEKFHKEESARKELDAAKKREEMEKRAREKELANTIDSIRREAEEQKQLRLHSEATAERLQYAEAELTQVRNLLKRAEKELQESNASRSPESPPPIPQELIDLLGDTYRRESLSYARKKADAEATLAHAKEYLDKVRKKKNSVLGNIRLAHSGSMDEVDAKMRDARMALEEVREDLKERRHRWQCIEIACGVSLSDGAEKQPMSRNESLEMSKRNLSSQSLISLVSTSTKSGASNVAKEDDVKKTD